MNSCKNCQFELKEGDEFCGRCGAKIIRKRLTIKNLFAHFVENFLNYDNKFFKTFWHLITRPEDVIDGYIKGIRKRYVSPVNYFAIALTLLGIQIFIINKYFPDWLDISAVSLDGSEEFTRKWMETVQEYQSLMFMANIPIYAFISRLVFWTLRRYNYTEFLVFFLYTVPQFTFALLIPQLIFMYFGSTIGELSLVFLFIQVLYYGYCFKRTLGLSITGLFLRFLMLIAVLAILYIILIIAFLGILFATGSMDDFIEAQKAIQEQQSG